MYTFSLSYYQKTSYKIVNVFIFICIICVFITIVIEINNYIERRIDTEVVDTEVVDTEVIIEVVHVNTDIVNKDIVNKDIVNKDILNIQY